MKKKTIDRDILNQLLKCLEEEMKLAKEYSIDLDRCNGSFKFGNHRISFFMGSKYKDIEVVNVTKNTILINVETWLEENSLDYNDIETEHSDIWDAHGFKDEADYIRYRYY